jgi:hypothetical protein
MSEKVKEWISKGRGFVGGLAYPAASSADDIYELLEICRDEKMRRLGVEITGVDDWLALCRDHRRVQRRMNEALMPLMMGYPDAGYDYNALQDEVRSWRGITAEMK